LTSQAFLQYLISFGNTNHWRSRGQLILLWLRIVHPIDKKANTTTLYLEYRILPNSRKYEYKKFNSLYIKEKTMNKPKYFILTPFIYSLLAPTESLCHTDLSVSIDQMFEDIQEMHRTVVNIKALCYSF